MQLSRTIKNHIYLLFALSCPPTVPLVRIGRADIPGERIFGNFVIPNNLSSAIETDGLNTLPHVFGNRFLPNCVITASQKIVLDSPLRLFGVFDSPRSPAQCEREGGFESGFISFF